jgi:hypothetical protein
MPPRENSRLQFAEGVVDADGCTLLTAVNPYRYRDLDDNEPYPVKDGDTLQRIAWEKYGDATLYFVIADFQPEPIHDPTLVLEAGTVLILPSYQTVFEEILGESARGDATA